MNRLRVAVGALLAGAGGMAITLPAYAQDALGEIVVTASKREESINKVGMTITALTADQLEERKITALEDIASVVPGLTYTPSTTNTPIFTLRGVGFNESSLGVYPAVSVYVDQVPLPFPVLASHSAFDLERIEVLKGPQGTLFGQNSTGGAINYIAAKPTKEFEAGADVSFGRFNQVDGTVYVSGPISETAGFRFSATGLTADDWQKSYTRRDSNGHQSYLAARLLVDFAPSDAVKVSVNLNGWKDKSQPQAQQIIAIHEQVTNSGPGFANAPAVNDAIRNYYSPPLNGAVSGQLGYPFSPFNPRAADWSTRNLDPETATQVPGGGTVIGSAGYTEYDPFSDRKFYQGALRADFTMASAITLTSLTSYADYDQNQATDGDGMYYVAYDLVRGEGTIKSFNQELRLANDPTGGFRWLVGGNYEDSTTSEDQMLRYYANSNHYPPNLYINSSGETLDQDIRNYAVFGNLEFAVGEKLTLKAGARYTNSKIDAVNFAYTQTNGNVDKLFNILGGLSGLPFTPIGPSDSYTLNSTPPASAIPKDLTINSPTASGPGVIPLFAGLGIPGIPLDATLKQNNVSWRASADFQATPDLLTYVSVSRGYKAGSFPALAAAAYISALPVVQESVTSYEVGFKASMADRKVQLNAAAFYYDYKDKQVRGKLFDFVFGTLDTLVNVPKSEIYGLDADLTVRPVDSLTVSLAGTYLKSKIKQYVGYDIFGGVDNANFTPGVVNTEDLSGNPLPYTPKWSGSLNLDYRMTATTGGSPFIGLTVSAKSGQDAAIGGGVTTLPVGPRYRIADGVGPYPYTIDGYAVVDARVGYEAEDGRWKVMLWAKNIFNKYYWTAVVPSSDSSARFAGRPATYGVSFGYKFE
jgi:iron complex outermembrane recepter protein